MAFDYASLRTGTVERLIGEFGDVGQLVIADESVGEPYESRLNNECEVDMQFVRTGFDKENFNGVLVEKGDQMIVVSTKGISIDPTLANRVILDCKEYQVIGIYPLQPGATKMLWRMHLRK